MFQLKYYFILEQNMGCYQNQFGISKADRINKYGSTSKTSSHSNENTL